MKSPNAQTDLLCVYPTRDLATLDALHRAYSGYPEGTLRRGVEDERNHYLKVVQGDQTAGYFSLKYKAPGIYEPHVCLAPSCRGLNAIAAGRALIQYAFTHLPCVTLVASILSNRRHVILVALRCGFREVARIAGSEFGIVLLTLNKGDR